MNQFSHAATITNYPSNPQITKDGTAVLMVDYATVPLSGRGGSINNSGSNTSLTGQLSRPNFLRVEPPDAPLSSTRLFVADLNRNLYILTKSNKVFTSYLNFQAIFPKFDNDPGYAGGVVTIAFDPAYAGNGRFFSVHTEDPTLAGSATPVSSNAPGLNLTGYTTTTAINPPVGSVTREAVLVEWTDTNISNATFEGTAREILRVGFNDIIHPMGDLLFNPLAQPGDDDYRNLYVANGDGGAGEDSTTRTIPQRLDALPGKILRITPDITLRPADELSTNGCYRIPTTGTNANPFVSVSLAGLRKEIWAYGFRNCHRISWDPVSNLILENEIGLESWEEVNIIHKGDNYGYSEREGVEQLFVGGANNGKTGSQIVPAVPFPTNDTLAVTGLGAPVTPTYPAALYSHEDGDAMSSGFVYRGSLMPGLAGKFIFGDIVNGRLFYCDLADMIASDDGLRTTVADIHELQIVYDHPDAGLSLWRMFDIVAVTYTNRGGIPPNGARLPGTATYFTTATNDIYGVGYGRGRADIRLAEGDDKEIYVISKTDGMIRKLTALLTPPSFQSINLAGPNVVLTWQTVPGWTNLLQFTTNLTSAVWTNLAAHVVTAGLTGVRTNAVTGKEGYYRVKLLVPVP